MDFFAARKFVPLARNYSENLTIFPRSFVRILLFGVSVSMFLRTLLEYSLPEG